MLDSEFDSELTYTDGIKLDKITRKLYIEFRLTLCSYILNFEFLIIMLRMPTRILRMFFTWEIPYTDTT